MPFFVYVKFFTYICSMENVKSKLDNIKFDVQATLLTIENDELLDDTFRGFCSIDYPKLHKMNEDGLLNDKVKGDIKEMFKLILRYNAEDYLMFAKRLGVYDGHVKETETEVEVTEQEPTKKPTKKQPNRPRVRIKKSEVSERKNTINKL